MMKRLFLLLLFPIALFAQTTTKGTIITGPFAARPVCSASFNATTANTGDIYNDSDDANTWKCALGTWSGFGGGGISFQNNGSTLPVEPFANCVPPLLCVDNSGSTRTDISCPVAVGVGVSHSAGCAPDPTASGNPLDYLGRDYAFHTSAGASAILPDPSTSLQYVAQTCAGGVACSDSNDGLSLGSAKLTIYAAIRNLPGGADYPGGSAGYAGVGTVYVAGPNVSVGGPVSNQGIWLMGANDPNFASPPSGWLKWGAFGIGGAVANLKIQGIAPMTGQANGRDTMAQLTGCGQQFGGPPAGGYPPCLWLSSITGFSMENISFPNYKHGSYVKVGITSTGDRTFAAGSSGIKLSNIGGNNGGGSLGDGPCVDVGSNVFWLNITSLNCNGTGLELYAVTASTGLSRSSGVVTSTTTTTNDLFVGQNITVYGASDSTFNGNFTVTGVSGSPQVTATWAQAGPNATSGGGYLWNDRAFSLAINPGTGTGSGAITIHDLQSSGGGVRVTCGTNGGGADGGYIFTDAPFGPAPTTLEFGGSGSSGHCEGSFEHIESADTTNGVPAVLNWSANFLNTSYVVGPGNQNIAGAATVISQDSHTAANSTVDPVRDGQNGFYQGYVLGKTDVARRLFSPTAVRFPNLASPNPTTWALGGDATLVTGILAPDGTNGAATYVSPSGFGVAFKYTSASQVLTPGEWWIGGVWTRAPLGTSTPGSVNFILGAQGNSATGDYCYGGVQQKIIQAYEAGDGQWFFVTVSCKIWSGPLNTEIGFGGGVNAGVVTGFYAPVFIHIPAGTLSDNEVSQLQQNLTSYSNAAVAGDVAMLPGQHLRTDDVVLNAIAAPTGGSGSTHVYMDSTANWPSFKPNGNTSYLIPGFTGSWVSGQCATATSTTNVFNLQPCPGGGGSGTINAAQQFSGPFYSVAGSATTLSGFAAPTVNGFWQYGWNVTGGAAVQPNKYQSGMGGAGVTGATSTYTVSYADCIGTTVTHAQTASSPVTITLPTATTLGNPGCVFAWENHSGSSDTIDASATAWTIQVNTTAAATTATIPSGFKLFLKVDPSGTNWVGDITPTSVGSNATSVNGASVPASAAVAGTNASSQIVAATSHGISAPRLCLDTSGSGTAQSCTTTPSFTPAAGDQIIYHTTTINTGALTLNVNASSAAPVTKNQASTPLIAGDVQTGPYIPMTFDAAGNWEMATAGNGPLSALAMGSTALNTASIASANCNLKTVPVTGATTSDIPFAVFNGDVTGPGQTGYIPSTNGTLYTYVYMTSGNINFKTCNNTTGPITPGAVTVNWLIPRTQ